MYIYICTFFDFQWNRKQNMGRTGGNTCLSNSTLHTLSQSYNPIFKHNIDAGPNIGSAHFLPPTSESHEECFVLIYSVLGWGFGVRVGFPFLIGKSFCEEITIDNLLLPSIPIHHHRWQPANITTTITYTSGRIITNYHLITTKSSYTRWSPFLVPLTPTAQMTSSANRRCVDGVPPQLAALSPGAPGKMGVQHHPVGKGSFHKPKPQLSNKMVRLNIENLKNSKFVGLYRFPIRVDMKSRATKIQWKIKRWEGSYFSCAFLLLQQIRFLLSIHSPKYIDINPQLIIPLVAPHLPVVIMTTPSHLHPTRKTHPPTAHLDVLVGCWSFDKIQVNYLSKLQHLNVLPNRTCWLPGKKNSNSKHHQKEIRSKSCNESLFCVKTCQA